MGYEFIETHNGWKKLKPLSALLWFVVKTMKGGKGGPEKYY